MELLKEKNGKAAIITTPWEQLTGDMISHALGSGRDLEEELMKAHEHHHECCGHDHDHEHHEHDHCHAHEHEEHGHEHHEHGHEHEDHEHGQHHHEHEHCHDHHHGHDHHDHHHADEIFSSWGIETIHKFSRKELEDALKMLSMTDNFGTVLRAKGIVEGEDGQWMEFDMVPEESEIRDCEPDYTGRICVIGTDLNTKDLAEVFGK